MLGFVFLVPWLRTLEQHRTARAALLSAWAMSVAFTAAAFAWFGIAIGRYTGLGPVAGVAVLLVAAPLLQPQFLAFALARHLADRRHGAAMRALAATAAWVATEAFMPKLLDDTLGYGLYPSRLLRQAADLGGAAGLTALLLLVNEAVAAATAQRTRGLRAMARPLALAALVPALLAGYGAVALSAATAPTAAARPLRIGLVQSDITDYDRLRRERGAAAVVREVLDTHFAMSYDAIEHQHADAVLWSETVYPTTFGHPKSAAGAALDQEILDTVKAAGVPFVFGTYDRDAAGEYNAAAFVAPGTGLVGFYRKTRLFPFTETLPAWLDSPALRRWLPWTGHWQPGAGARVFPLQLADGREIPVLPLICRDDMDPALAAAGTRLGARAILTLSNDSWFPEQGARLHETAAAFRSIETRLPQFRVTTSGYSAVIDATGRVIAGTRMGERTLVIGAQPVREAPHTLVVAWGDWVGRVAALFLVLLAVAAVFGAAARPHPAGAGRPVPPPLPAKVAVLPPAARVLAGALRAFSRGSLLALGAAFLLGEARLQTDTLAQIRSFIALFLVPEAAAWCVLQAFGARAFIEDGQLVLARGAHRLALPLRDIAGVEPWSLPIPGPGAWLQLRSGGRWRHGLAHPDPVALAMVLADTAHPAPPAGRPSCAVAYAQARHAPRPARLARPIAKFVLFPLVLALPAFRLHQHIAYGSGFGEYYSFGLKAYLTTFGLWWAAWAIGVVICAAALRAAIEAATLATVLLRPAEAAGVRSALERLGLVTLYLGLPAWLLARLVLS
jgi:apolipoprotein N-acyltransferase